MGFSPGRIMGESGAEAKRAGGGEEVEELKV